VSYIRKLPSGKWQATVRGLDGRKHTMTDPLQKVVKMWATDQEAKFGQGDTRDPRRVTSESATGTPGTRRPAASSGSPRRRTRPCG